MKNQWNSLNQELREDKQWVKENLDRYLIEISKDAAKELFDRIPILYVDEDGNDAYISSYEIIEKCDMLAIERTVF